MLITKSFDHILQQIQTLCLNYQIQISPFSALISLKKSLIKDRLGNKAFQKMNSLENNSLTLK